MDLDQRLSAPFISWLNPIKSKEIKPRDTEDFYMLMSALTFY